MQYVVGLLRTHIDSCWCVPLEREVHKAKKTLAADCVSAYLHEKPWPLYIYILPLPRHLEHAVSHHISTTQL